MSNTKTEAQRLAALLDHGNDTSQIEREVIDELRRLDSENQRQRADLERKSEAIQRLWAERDQLRAQLSKAVAEEREACANVCDRIDLEYEGEDVQATWCAAAIRARKDNK